MFWNITFSQNENKLRAVSKVASVADITHTSIKRTKSLVEFTKEVYSFVCSRVYAER